MNIEDSVTINRAHDYITARKWREYAPSCKELQKIVDIMIECDKCDEKDFEKNICKNLKWKNICKNCM